MSTAGTPDDSGHRTKRLKLSQPRQEGTARFRMSVDGLIEEPVGSRGPPRKGGSLTGRGKNVRASTGNISSSVANNVAQNMVNDIFSPVTDKPPTTPFLVKNGVATPPPSTDTPNGASDRRNVSGPGQFTPRALLKDEDQFFNIGIDAGLLLRLRGEYISWWMAECVLRVAQYLEKPQEGAPSTINARPDNLPITRNGQKPAHCCEEGGITHLLPCNFSKPPTAKEAFGFAASKREVLVSEHHASKGGINTIAFVGDLVLDKFVGQSKIDEDEFKLLAGSEHLRQFLRKGEKRYKAPDPHVDPTKQPILLLKSFKKMAMNEEFVETLKLKYAWALAEFPHLVGPKEPEPITPPEPSPVPAFAQRASTTKPALNLAPAPTPGSTSATNKKIKREAGTPSEKRSAAKRPYDTYREPLMPINDARMSRRPEFPVHVLSEEESTHLANTIYEIEAVIEEIADPMNVINNMPPPVAKPVSKGVSPARKSTRGRKKSARASDQINILLDATLGEAAGAEDAGCEGAPATRLPEPIPDNFALPVSPNFDGYIRTCIEYVVNGIIRDYPDEVGHNSKVKAVLEQRFTKLQHAVLDVDFRINTMVSSVCGRAITDLYAFLHEKIDRQPPKRAAPGSPTGQLTM